MNIKELSSFLNVCETKSISKASKELFISPQGLSKTIKNLEKELGVSLFVRSPIGITLTKHGEILERNAKSIIDDLEKLEHEMDSAIKCDKEKIKLVSSYGVLRLLTPECILEFNRIHSNISLEYEEYPDMYIDEYVKKNKADIGFAIEPIDDREFNKVSIKTFELKLLVHKNHPLSKKNLITNEDINNVDMVIENKGFKLHHIVGRHFKEAGVKPNIIFVTSGFSLCHKLCAQNKCVSITMDFINRDMKNNDLVVIPFEDKSLKWTICMITKRGHISDTLRMFENYILNWVKNIE
ncbi:LysR family transcriptional regulator [Clostridium tyrobutyricum]|uniref:LysR family transcriptional regulator n=1 Tax=Clostridium tyrobutyricum TaxID=1519 RepID=UPI00057DDE9A|nr:LysR family transcriptional regulator [Clostridium tyrobutyricum]